MDSDEDEAQFVFRDQRGQGRGDGGGRGRGRGVFIRDRGDGNQEGRGGEHGERRRDHDADDRGGRGGGFRGRGRGGRGGAGPRGLDFRQLQELRTKDPSTIVMALGLDSGLKALLQRYNINSHLMYLLFDCLAQACSCTSAPGNVIQIFLTIQQSKLYDHTTGVLTEIHQRPNENGREKRQFIKDVLSFMKELSIRLPHSFTTVQVLGLQSYLEMVVVILKCDRML